MQSTRRNNTEQAVSNIKFTKEETDRLVSNCANKILSAFLSHAGVYDFTTADIRVSISTRSTIPTISFAFTNKGEGNHKSLRERFAFFLMEHLSKYTAKPTYFVDVNTMDPKIESDQLLWLINCIDPRQQYANQLLIDALNYHYNPANILPPQYPCLENYFGSLCERHDSLPQKKYDPPPAGDQLSSSSQTASSSTDNYATLFATQSHEAAQQSRVAHPVQDGLLPMQRTRRNNTEQAVSNIRITKEETDRLLSNCASKILSAFLSHAGVRYFTEGDIILSISTRFTIPIISFVFTNKNEDNRKRLREDFTLLFLSEYLSKYTAKPTYFVGIDTMDPWIESDQLLWLINCIDPKQQSANQLLIDALNYHYNPANIPPPPPQYPCPENYFESLCVRR